MAQRAEAALAVQVTPPDRPRRAAGVRLGGKLEDSAFERQQYSHLAVAPRPLNVSE